jgi:diacylglycerol kinase family enzyme
MSSTPLMNDSQVNQTFDGVGTEGVIKADGSGTIKIKETLGYANIQLVLMNDSLNVYHEHDMTASCSKHKFMLHLCDVIGAIPRDKVIDVYSYIQDGRCCKGRAERKRYVHTFQFLNNDDCQEWATKINVALGDGTSDERRQFLVLLNPVSGTGSAKHVYDSVVKKMFDEARIDAQLIITERMNHASDIVASEAFDLKSFDAVVVIGGDGLLYEVINGIAKRPTDGMELLKSIPIAPIPGGTGNGLAKSVLFESHDELYGVCAATFIAIKGKPCPLDLSMVMTKDEKLFSFLTMSWGLISDVDIGSEGLRCLGELRLYLAAVYYIACRRSYKGRLLMHMRDVEDSEHTKSEDIESQGCDRIFGDSDFIADTPRGHLKIVEGTFQLIWVVQTPYAASTMYVGPGVELSDGIFTIYVVQDMSTMELLRLLIDVDTGAHVNARGVQTYKAYSYRIEPFFGGGDAGNGRVDTAGGSEDSESNGGGSISDRGEYRGIYAVDGESVGGPRLDSIQGKVLPGAARIMKLM